MRKLFLSPLFMLAVGIGTAQAQVVVNIAPPRARVEHRSARPSKDHVWINGFQRWNGKAYEWSRAAGRNGPTHMLYGWLRNGSIGAMDGYLWKVTGGSRGIGGAACVDGRMPGMVSRIL